ncbi:hypothetical protein VTK56DRAFT_6663 [Thermocarpiscus australiensis]
MRRHEATHLKLEQFKCVSCGRLFRRRDVWRKHYTGCPSNNHHESPPPAKRGKKPRACDACFRSKLSCHGGSPCERCKSRQLECTYTRVHANGSDAPSTPLTASTPTQDGNTTIPVSFLLSLTNPKAESMVEAFFDEPGRDDDAPSVVLQSDTDPGFSADFLEGVVAGTGFFPWEFGQLPQDTTLEDGTGNSVPQQRDCNATDGINPALAPIIDELKQLHDTLRATDASYDGTFDTDLARQIFLSSSNREMFVSAYFRHTHRDRPFLHRPSFSPDTSSPVLLLAVSLCGSLYTPPRDSVLAIPSFFRIAEEYAFRNLETQLARRQETGDDTQELYEAVQAALLIHGLQFVTHKPAAQRRSRVIRRPALVAAVRALGLTAAKHSQTGERPDWGQFIRDETRIRLATWTLLADWQQSGVHHLPPLMTVHEMNGDLPCLNELWEANDAAEFEAVVAARGKGCWRRSASLRLCVDALMGDHWSGVEHFPLSHVSIHDLNLLIFALHSVIACARLMTLLRSSASAILRALDRWQELWRATAGTLDAEHLRRSGFVRHSGELHWLARKLVEHSLSGKDKTSAYLQGVDHETLNELHEFLRELRDL